MPKLSPQNLTSPSKLLVARTCKSGDKASPVIDYNGKELRKMLKMFIKLKDTILR